MLNQDPFIGQEISLAHHHIGLHHPPFIVAELSGNHNGSLTRALRLVEAAKEAGAHAIKLQTYTADSLTMDVKSADFYIDNPSSKWSGRYLYDLYQEAHLPQEWHQPLFDRCRALGLIGFSTPFSEEAVDFLEKLHVPAYKIASPEIVHLPLIAKVAATGKPLILSTGASTLQDIEQAVHTARLAGCRQLILLKCTTAYPADPADINLKTLPDLAARFNTLVGLSDHTLDIGVSIAAVALGACVIEKHLTFSRAEGGVDSHFSLEPAELAALVRETRQAWQALGSINYSVGESEAVTHSHRPSLYFNADLEAGTVIQAEHIRVVRPGYGLPPKERAQVIGKTLKESVKRGARVSWSAFS